MNCCFSALLQTFRWRLIDGDKLLEIKAEVVEQSHIQHLRNERKVSVSHSQGQYRTASTQQAN